MKTRPGVVTMALAALPALPACDGPTPERTGGESYTIEIRHMAFHPDELRVEPGDTVVWINRDLVPHNIAETRGEWASPALEREERWRLVAQDDGPFEYLCDFHPTMQARVVVSQGAPGEDR